MHRDDRREDPSLVEQFRELVRSGGWTGLESGSTGIEIYRRDGTGQVPQANAK
jgi:hypothetical protein